MRNLAVLLSATLLSVALLFMSHGYFSRKDTRPTPIIVQAAATEMAQATKLHLIKASFKVNTPTGSGTGFAIFSGQRKSASGDTKYYNYLVTCAHVTRGSETVSVEQFHYSEDRRIFASTSYEGKVLLLDTAHDLSLIEVASDVPFRDVVSLVTPADYKKMKLGEQVWVVGCGLANPPYVSSAGYVASFDSEQIRVTSPIIFGNSGGGMYTIDGKLLGVCRAIPIMHNWNQVYPNCGYCVPVWTVDIWLRINGYGFLNHANDGSSLDRIFEIRERAELEYFKIQSERALKKMLDDLIKKMTPPEPEPEVKPEPNKPEGKGELYHHKPREEEKKRRWLLK